MDQIEKHRFIEEPELAPDGHSMFCESAEKGYYSKRSLLFNSTASNPSQEDNSVKILFSSKRSEGSRSRAVITILSKSDDDILEKPDSELSSAAFLYRELGIDSLLE
jgi:hypothetical protein